MKMAVNIIKKKEPLELLVINTQYPNEGVALFEGNIILVKDTLPGERILAQVTKKKKDVFYARKMNTLSPSPLEMPSNCIHFGRCGGCAYQHIAYEDEIALKKKHVLKLLADSGISVGTEPMIHGSPIEKSYRNKMEFSFGDDYKNGPLSLGLRRKSSFYEVETVTSCQIVNDCYRLIIKHALEFFKSTGLTYYNKRTHEGCLRHLVVRYSEYENSLLINLVATSNYPAHLVDEFKEMLLKLPLSAGFAGIFFTPNDDLADTVKLDHMQLLHGKGFFTEQLFGLSFRVDPASFFQTNTKGASLLYARAIALAGDLHNKTVLDLYSGTGTITQIMANSAKMAIGIELVPEAVLAARENARLNGITNCQFIKGDVLAELETLAVKPDLIVLDPPRAGVHPKALKKILAYQAPQILYISCNPKALAVDLPAMIEKGYVLTKFELIDLFPRTTHVETVVLLESVKMKVV